MPGQRGTYILLEILREEGKQDVFEILPGSVYTVTAHGPLSHTPNHRVHTGQAKGSKLVGSFATRGKAKEAAEKAMEEMVKGEEGVKRSDHWGRSRKGARVGGGLLMAMNSQARWEVRVGYDEEVMRRVREGAEMRGEKVAWRV